MSGKRRGMSYCDRGGGRRSQGGSSLEVSRLDILRPRWVARIGVTRSTEACFLTADRQCTELPLLRLPRLVPEVARG